MARKGGCEETKPRAPSNSPSREDSGDKGLYKGRQGLFLASLLQFFNSLALNKHFCHLHIEGSGEFDILAIARNDMYGMT